MTEKQLAYISLIIFVVQAVGTFGLIAYLLL